MLEVVFDSSTKGALRHAKRYDPDSWKKGAMAFIGERPTDEQLADMHRGKPVPGSPWDVVQLGWSLDMGSLAGGGILGDARKVLYARQHGLFPQHPPDVERVFQELSADRERILEEASRGTPIRAWVDRTPAGMCGFHCLCSLLSAMDCTLGKLIMPEEAMGWNQVHPGKFYEYLPLETEVPAMERRAGSIRWRSLVEENAPLRALVSGRLVSVQEDFYDTFIRRCLPEGPVVLGRLLGTILDKYPLGMGDAWYRMRIEAMLESGELVVAGAKDEDHPYGMIIKKNRKPSGNGWEDSPGTF